ncbi:MAG TPA: SUMF1/EgtB/PvdO family nonheme iron enzyme [Candidatus Sumerlaeota bacterium]|nr:SUMF1/EgtB/PvdO family nonheme iron enzyme [Candidatus Sumerlaeota bacterium]
MLRKLLPFLLLTWGIASLPAAPGVEGMIQTLSEALKAYEKDVGTYPSTEQGLSALAKRPMTVNPETWKGPYITEVPIDPWGNMFEYVFPGKDGDYDLFSRGPDGVAGTADDAGMGEKAPASGKTGPASGGADPLFPEIDARRNYTEAAGNLNAQMVWIGPGRFVYGSHRTTRHSPPEVTLRGYWIGRHEITAEQFCIFLNAADDPEKNEYLTLFEGSTIIRRDGVYYPRPGCEKKPAYPVSWLGADAFCRMLSEGTGLKYRLPTEAQWERAARGGLRMKKFPWGEDPPYSRANVARGEGKDWERLTAVGTFAPNAYGLYDVTGNAMEWCRDWWDESAVVETTMDPEGPKRGINKVMRGGNFISRMEFTHVGYRFSNPPWFKSGGFRIVREP